MNRTVIIIPVHNRCATTLAGLHHLRANGDLAAFPVLVIDDGSTDGTAAAVQHKFPEVELLSGNGQLWWTGAMRCGMQSAFGRGAASIVWLNDDCLPEPGALAALAERTLRDGVTLAGPTCRTETGASVPTGFIGRQTIAVEPGGEKTVDGLSGYCVAVPRAAWERLGPPDGEKFPHYYGDSAYTLAAKRAGFTVVLTGKAGVRLPDYAPTPTSPSTGRRPGRSWRENWRQVFVSKKSPFRLATQWHYLRLKYGAWAGTLLAVARTLVWVLRFFLGRPHPI